MTLNRRMFCRHVALSPFIAALAAVRCRNISTLPSPTSTEQATTSLLARVQAAGYANAQRVPYKNNGAARIAIDGSTMWNFLVNGQLIGLDSSRDGTIDVSALQVPLDAPFEVRHVQVLA